MVAVETFIAERPLSAKGNRVAGPPVAEPVYVYPRPYNWGPGPLGATQNSSLHSTRPIATLESSRRRRAAARKRLRECFLPGFLRVAMNTRSHRKHGIACSQLFPPHRGLVSLMPMHDPADREPWFHVYFLSHRVSFHCCWRSFDE